MRRRRFLAALGLSLAAPRVRAQRAPARVAWVSPTTAADGELFLGALRQGLRERGYTEGRDLLIEPHWGDDSAERTEKLAAAVVASRPQVIVVQGPAALALRRATPEIPVVFGFSGDPVEAGLVESLARPGRNLTGISFLTLELVGKRVELMREVLPRAKRIAVLANPQHAGDKAERRVSEHAATRLGMSLEYFEARSATQVDEGLAAIEKAKCDAAMMFPVQFVISRRKQIAEWAIRHRVPTVSGWAQFAEGGNLMSYGPNLRDSYRRLAEYADRILKGARPAELPTELPTRVEFVINLAAARALGITVPRAVLLRADRVIE